ncbi:PPC domain-containing DNA-binding protein [Deminuibacter soli]|uniref:DNA-binding protein n=1 Tax=Deminuibacter soli TaxID=2291815 RepID=A0A3E1NFU7_9BACT|nr:PPC domain-containing DNA-binding protein [Deminuibacter soli]RFM26845.1 DNA-binding protein [Deminuibacter soli]
MKILSMAALLLGLCTRLFAQDYVSPVKPAETGKSPGVKVKLLSTVGETKTYALIFSTGDEVVSGLTEFAQKYNVKSAHYTAIGDATSAKVGWYDKSRKMFKVIPIPEPSEVTSLVGDVAVFGGKPVAHSHVNVATEDGLTHGGHLLQLIVGPTLELIITVEPTPMYKVLNEEFGAGVIDPTKTE